MATGGNLEKTVVGSADDEDESQQNASADGDTTMHIKYKCTPCAESNNVREASHYCPECNEFYCGQCLRFHSRHLRNHVVYGKSEADKWGQKAPCTQLIEKCTKHPTETINMLCCADNQLCCPVCISLEHNTCYKKEYIPSAANGVTRSEKLRTVKSQLEKESNNADKYKSLNEGFTQDLNFKQASFLQQIADMRKQVNDVFDEMEERATLGLTHFGNTLHVNIREEINVCDELKREMDQFAVKLENTENKNECQVFIDMVKAENMVKKAENAMEELHASNEDVRIVDGFQFNSNSNLHQKLQEIKTFGQVSCTYNIKCKQSDYCPYDDTHLDCCIEGMVQLEDSTFVLADSSHFCLKWLSPTYKVKAKAELTDPPSALCIIGVKQVAVSLKNNLEVFMIDGEITRVQHLDLSFSHPCCGLAYSNQKYYITDRNDTVYIYNKTGHCVKKIQTIGSGKLFESIRNIAIGVGARKIYVTDIDKGLITMDMNGQVLSTLETKETKGAYGVCVTNDGRVLVTNYLQDNVIEVDRDGQNVLQNNLISLPSGQSPRSVCYDRQNSCLVVSNNYLGGSGYLSVFQL